MKPSSIAITIAAAAALFCAPLVARSQDAASQSGAQAEAKGAGITEDQIRARLTGKLLFLRGFYLDNGLNFNENGGVIGSPATGSFTLCAIEIKKARLTKHKLELEGDRYGLHFYGALPYEDDNKPYDRVRLTTKRSLHISIDRELVVIPKVKKAKKGDVKLAAKTAPAGAASSAEGAEAPAEQASAPAAPAVPAAVDPNAVTTTASPAHSAKLLNQAIDNIFAERIDDRMMAKLPDYWQFYFHEKVLKHGFKPSDPGVLRLDADTKPPKMLNSLEPDSNEYAQKNGIAGITLFRTVVDAQGKPTEIAIARPIGFGLDEKAVEAIRKSRFAPAMKDGKPVPVVVDLVVTFRIFSNRTRGTAIGGAPKPPVAEALTKPTASQTAN